MTTETVILAKNLSKTFGANVVVDSLSFDIHRGEVFGLLGPNGAGKTTTIRMLAALIAPTSGEAIVSGYSVLSLGHLIRRKIGILTESPGLYDGLNAERNLSFFAQMYDLENPEQQIEKYLKMLGLWERRFDLVSEFSKGMRQKLALARALLHEPEILFLDEPTSGLDPEMARLVRDFINEVREQGRTILLTTHNLDVAEDLCDRVGILKTRLLALSEPGILRRDLFGRAVVFHLGQPATGYLDMVKSLSSVQSAEAIENKLVLKLADPETENPAIVRILVEASADIQFVGEIRRSLEDIYLQIVRDDEAKQL